MLRIAICCSLFALSIAEANEDYDTIFETAVDAVDFEFDRSWAYTETQVTDEHIWVGRYDPRRSPGERWQLMTVDGRQPTGEELEEYGQDKAHDHSRDGDERVNAMVEPDTVSFIEETDEYWLFGFTPDKEEIMNSVDATIRINKGNGHLEYIDIRNHETIRPTFGVKISKLITRLTFGRASEDGPVVPISTQVEVKGRAYLVVAFDEQEVRRNSDFEYVGVE